MHSAICCECIGAALLRKYYDDFWMSLPKNYMDTLEKFYKPGGAIDTSKIIGLSDLITACPNSTVSNQMLIDIFIFTAKNDTQLLGFSYLLEKLVKDSKISVIKSFRNGLL